MDSRDGLPRGVLPSGILKIEKYCPGLKVRSPSEFRKANAGNFNIREMSHLDEVIKEHYVPRTELNKL